MARSEKRGKGWTHGSKSRREQPIVPPADFHPPSNGEFVPTPPTQRALRAEAIWRDIVETKHRRLGMSRRQFAESACGVTAWLLAMNQAACSDGAGGVQGQGGAGGSSTGTADGGVIGMDAAGYDVDAGMLEDVAKAREKLAGDEFIFDVQVHVANPPLDDWTGKTPPERALDFIKTVFAQSDTTVACISGVPSARDHGIRNVAARARLQEIIDRFGGPRLIYHVNSDPTRADELDHMAAAAAMYKPGAWKTYPISGANRLDSDAVGVPFIEQARKLGVRNICCHRGISANGDYNHQGSPLDVVRAAKKFPDVNFLMYHSGWEGNANEQATYNPDNTNPMGVDRLIRALKETGIGPNGNVYAELGSTWNGLKNDLTAAAHVLGKLLTHLGPDRIVWGTDSVFNGNPQAQIVAMRKFVIPEQMQQEFGYPALTDEIRRKIFGLNGARVYGVDPSATRYIIKDDEIDGLKMAFNDDRDAVKLPDRREYLGPRTRREYLDFLRRA